MITNRHGDLLLLMLRYANVLGVRRKGVTEAAGKLQRVLAAGVLVGELPLLWVCPTLHRHCIVQSRARLPSRTISKKVVRIRRELCARRHTKVSVKHR